VRIAIASDLLVVESHEMAATITNGRSAGEPSTAKLRALSTATDDRSRPRRKPDHPCDPGHSQAHRIELRRRRNTGRGVMSGIGYRIIAFFGISAVCTAFLALPYVTGP
jgi:hypothetical protein